MKLRIGTKLGLGFAAVLVLLAVLGAVSFTSNRSIHKNLKDIDIINERLSTEYSIENYFYRAVAAIRGYIAYGKQNYKDDCIANINKTVELEKKLLEIAAEEKKQEVQKLIEVTETYRRGLIEDLMPAVARQHAETNPIAREPLAAETIRIASGLVPMTNQLTEIIRGLVESNQKLLAEKIKSSESSASGVVTTSVILTLLAILVGAAVAFFITNSIRKPVLAMAQGAEQLATGDFTVAIDVKTGDEVGDLARSLNDMAGQLKALIADIATTAQTLAAHSEELAASAEEVSATVEEVASTTNEVASMAEKSLENANRTAEESKKMAATAETGSATVKKTIEKINSIATSAEHMGRSVQSLGELSSRIGNITNVITGIADQTNLLALNAAIEAARAGEQGRGFAVVAEEVRKLAEQSAAAAKEIGQLIGQIQAGVETAIRAMEQGAAEVKEGVDLASEAGSALQGIMSAVAENIELINEIIQGARQSSEGTQQLSASNEQVTSTIQQVASATQQLAEIAGRLQSAVAKFKV